MASIEFKKNGSVYEAEIQLNAVSAIHIERKISGAFIVEQTHFKDTEYAPLTNKGNMDWTRKNLDFNVMDKVFPVYLHLVSTTPITNAVIVGDGEQHFVDPEWVCILYSPKHGAGVDTMRPCIKENGVLYPIYYKVEEGLQYGDYLHGTEYSSGGTWASEKGLGWGFTIQSLADALRTGIYSCPYPLCAEGEMVKATPFLRSSFKKVMRTCETYENAI